MVDTHLIPLAQDRGIATATTGLAVALLAAANVTGILASGPLADRVDNLVLFGLVDFSTVAPTQWLAARYVQPQAVGLAFGCLNATHQLGSALGAWLPGVAYDASGSYDSVLVVSASVLAVAALTCLTLPRPRPLAPHPA